MRNKQELSRIKTTLCFAALSLSFVMPLAAQPRCFSYVDDFGAETDNRIRSLGTEIRAQQIELRLMKKKTKNYQYDREVVLARMAIFQLQKKKQLLDNKCFKDRCGPRFSFR